MESFSLQLCNDGIVTGLRTPALAHRPPKDTPLIVGFHGGSYCAEYYDATKIHSALPYSGSLRVPFVSVNGPGYKSSTALPESIPENSSFFQEEGKYLHDEILPAIWQAYSTEYGVSSVVILAHSLSVPMSIVAASFNATLTSSTANKPQENKVGKEIKEKEEPEPRRQQQQPEIDEDRQPNNEGEKQTESGKRNIETYPLAGIVLSGFGIVPNADIMARVHPFVDPKAGHVTFPLAFKNEIMLLPPSSSFTGSEIYEQTERLNTTVSLAELSDAYGPWPSYWKERYAKHVKCPVMYALAEKDCFWMPNSEAMTDFAGAFEASVRVETGVVGGGVHCLKLCRAGRGWYARVFGWAIECGVAHGLGRF
ncbi:MAG: hypothetical protein Q9182_005028 [Xanthomendoza sp. 2 TL-2023]